MLHFLKIGIAIRPGASSLLGLLEEFGPILMTEEGGLRSNDFAWTNLVDYVWVDQPVYVIIFITEEYVRIDFFLTTFSSTVVLVLLLPIALVMVSITHNSSSRRFLLTKISL